MVPIGDPLDRPFRNQSHHRDTEITEKNKDSQEFLQCGATVEDMLEVASLLEKAGVDAIEMSGANHVEGIFGECFPARKRKPNEDDVPH